MKNLAALLLIPALTFGNQKNNKNYDSQTAMNAIANSSPRIESIQVTDSGHYNVRLNDAMGIVDIVGRNSSDLKNVYEFNSFAGKGVPVGAKISSNLPSNSYGANVSGSNTIAQVTNSITQESVPSYITGVEDVLKLVIGGNEYQLKVSSGPKGLFDRNCYIDKNIKIQEGYFKP